jgi:hypothetical protein
MPDHLPHRLLQGFSPDPLLRMRWMLAHARLHPPALARPRQSAKR